MAQRINSENVLLLSTLSILQIIREAQQQHGLRHSDFQRYRAYCARKLRRLRKSLHVTNTHKPRNFQRKSYVCDQIATDIRFLHICLYEAERCWAYSMQLKQETEAEPRKKFHMIKKLKKAVQHANELEKFCANEEVRIDVASKLEAQAYRHWLNGCLSFELQNWQLAKDNFTAAKTIYDNLSNASELISPTDQGKSTAAELYQQRCQEMLAPQLRYCAFKIGDESAAADLMEMRRHLATDHETRVLADIDTLIAQTREKQIELMKSEIVWCNYKIDISKAPSKVKTFQANLKQFDLQLDQAESFDAKISAYEQLLIDCRDATQAVRDEYKNENFKLKQEDGDTAEEETFLIKDVQLLYNWLVFVRLTKTLDKYLLLIKNQQSSLTTTDGVSCASSFKCSKPQDMVRLYDAVLQNLSDIVQLPGTHNDPKLVADIECCTAYFSTFRCYYVAEVFFGLKKWREALALYLRCVERCQQARDLLSNRSSTYTASFGVDVATLDELVSVLNSAKHTTHANCLMDSSVVAADSSAVRPGDEKVFIDELVAFRRLTPQDVVGPKRTVNVTRMPPDFKPMPCKPLFFDLALNHLRFPSLESKIETTEAAAGAALSGSDKQGLGGLVKGWFWGSSGKK